LRILLLLLGRCGKLFFVYNMDICMYIAVHAGLGIALQ
jgi:hypothetical protein